MDTANWRGSEKLPDVDGKYLEKRNTNWFEIGRNKVHREITLCILLTASPGMVLIFCFASSSTLIFYFCFLLGLFFPSLQEMIMPFIIKFFLSPYLSQIFPFANSFACILCHGALWKPLFCSRFYERTDLKYKFQANCCLACWTITTYDGTNSQWRMLGIWSTLIYTPENPMIILMWRKNMWDV